MPKGKVRKSKRKPGQYTTMPVKGLKPVKGKPIKKIKPKKRRPVKRPGRYTILPVRKQFV